MDIEKSIDRALIAQGLSSCLYNVSVTTIGCPLCSIFIFAVLRNVTYFLFCGFNGFK